MNNRSFALVVDGEVFMVYEISSSHPGFDRLSEAMVNSPEFLNCTNHPDASLIGNGWIWDGTNFNPPA